MDDQLAAKGDAGASGVAHRGIGRIRDARGSSAFVDAGRFGAHMEVSLTNDGPVTIWSAVVATEAQAATG